MNNKSLIFKLSFFVFFLSVSFLFSSSASADQCTCRSLIDPGSSETIIKEGVLCGPSNITCFSACLPNQIRDCITDDLPTVSAEPTKKVPESASPTKIPPQALPNPLGITDVNAFIAQLINFVLSLVGSVSLLLFVYGGITWMTSAGAPAAVKKGKDIVVWAVIGLAVVFTSYILVKFVIQGITGA